MYPDKWLWQKTTEALCLRDLLLVPTWFKNGRMKGKCLANEAEASIIQNLIGAGDNYPSSPSRGKWGQVYILCSEHPSGTEFQLSILLVSWWFTSCWLPSFPASFLTPILVLYWHHLPNKLCAKTFSSLSLSRVCNLRHIRWDLWYNNLILIENMKSSPTSTLELSLEWKQFTFL